MTIKAAVLIALVIAYYLAEPDSVEEMLLCLAAVALF